MPYSKTNWVEDVTPLSPTNMNKLETQYDEAVKDIKGTTNADIAKYTTLELAIDTRTTVLTYDSTTGDLVKVEEEDGATVIKTTNLAYTSGNLTTVEEIAGGTTVTTTMNYDADGNLTSTSKAVV
jgi:YD repeat-containing protein